MTSPRSCLPGARSPIAWLPHRVSAPSTIPNDRRKSMNQSVQERQGLLKKALTGNAVFSVVSGLAILFANRWLVKFLGLPDKVSLAILGVSLIVYATILWLNWIAVFLDSVSVIRTDRLIFFLHLHISYSS